MPFGLSLSKPLSSHARETLFCLPA